MKLELKSKDLVRKNRYLNQANLALYLEILKDCQLETC
jgi:hypothetical protein